MKTTPLALFAAAFLFAGNGMAQTDSGGNSKKPLPDGPLLGQAPNPGQWVVTISYPDEKARSQVGATAAAPPMADHLKLRPHIITTTRVKNLVHEVINVIQGPPQEKWYVGTVQYWKIGAGPEWALSQPGLGATAAEGYTVLPTIGFRDLAWVGEGTYVDTVSYKDKQCLLFKASGPAGHQDQGQVAYIDLKTRWPVEVQMGGEVRTYQFGAPPSETLVLPDDLKQQIARGEKVRAHLDMRPESAP